MSDTEEATPTEAVEATEVAEATPLDQTDDQAPAEEVEGEELDDQSEAAAEELEEVEWEGKKVRVPAEVKAALMRTADYTRKTQAVAEAAKQIEARNEAIEQRAQALETTIETRAELVAARAQIEAFNKLSDEDWDALEEEDPREFKRLQRQHQKLTARAHELTTTLQTKETEALEAERTQFATRIKESQAVLARDIKGWGPDLARQITDFGKAEGMTNEELVKLNAQPTLVKVLHKAMLGAAAMKQLAATKKVQTAQQTKPGSTVGGASPNARRTTDASGDGLSTAEWMRREEERVTALRKRA